MSRRGLAVVVVLAGAGILLTVAAVLRSRSSHGELPGYFDAPSFVLSDQDGRPFHSGDLGGRVWVVDFIYTNCPDICPAVTANLARIRDELRREQHLGSDVRFVSITVDPDRDTAAALKKFGASFGVRDPREWAFLTGAEPALRRVLEDFHVAAAPASSDRGAPGLITHSSQVMLVDRRGRVRGIYAGTDRHDMDRLSREIHTLL